jgi:Flp pilus assembly protein TadG
MSLNAKPQNRRKAERGSVTVMTAVLLGGLVLLLGMSIDVSRIYMVRSGLQNAADAAALAAARELNSGTAGLTDAVAQAQSVGLQANKYGLNRTGNTAPSVTISKVEFAASLNGPWYNGAAAASAVVTTIKFVRVTTQSTSTNMLFAAKALGSAHVEERTAVAGMSVPLNTVCNFFPVAVALLNPFPANHAQLTFRYTDGTGNSITVGDMHYLVLNVPDINGVGQPETANLAAGITTICASIGSTIGLNNSPSANSTNGPKSIADGANTRFDSYQNGYANSLNATAYPPDTNVYDNTGNPLTTTQYLNKSPISTPPRNPPGQDDRRILIMPIVPPATYTGSPPLVPIVRFGAFLLRNSMDRTGNCNGNGPCAGAMKVEYLGDDFVIPRGEYDPNNPCALLLNPCSSLTKSVMYR